MMLTRSFYELFNYEIREVSVTEDRQNNKDKYYLSISGQRAVEILIQLGILIEYEEGVAVDLQFYGDLTKKDCWVKSFIKGLFVSSGRCILPTENHSTTGYHLEIYFSHYAPALETSEKLAQNGVLTRIVKRREGYIVYIKSAEDIKDFLAFLPAPISVLKLTDLMIERELANKINRQKNCDLGNVNKQVEASVKQINAIKKIDKIIGLEGLKPDLMATAKARLENPDETLNELAEILNISKSCLNHRLRKIVEIAEQL